ncbi:hypothetical protein WJX73_006789 [Symbiochloris irregularis]|uniref:Uncharacterized protein n=1 Tax=Symbiochloris irregularis TaxID=706552 RepID=A0AAW1NS57_9CHLO
MEAWAENDLLQNCEAVYCDMQPQPRSTIAIAFSSDGSMLASTHGDHTVKLTCLRQCCCIKTLVGHRRTPWVVRFHPLRPNILVSGSLDYEVRVWDANSGACLHSHNFGRPIASLAFKADGSLLAIASGHTLFAWVFDEDCQPQGLPVPVLKTRRSMRAIHFHPFGAPLMLSAEVNNPPAPSSQPPPMTIASNLARTATEPASLPEPHLPYRSQSEQQHLPDTIAQQITRRSEPAAEADDWGAGANHNSPPRHSSPGRRRGTDGSQDLHELLQHGSQSVDMADVEAGWGLSPAAQQRLAMHNGQVLGDDNTHSLEWHLARQPAEAPAHPAHHSMQGIEASEHAQSRQQAAAMQPADPPGAMDQVWVGRNDGAMHPETGHVPTPGLIRGWPALPVPAALRHIAAAGAVLPRSMVNLGWECDSLRGRWRRQSEQRQQRRWALSHPAA